MVPFPAAQCNSTAPYLSRAWQQSNEGGCRSKHCTNCANVPLVWMHSHGSLYILGCDETTVVAFAVEAEGSCGTSCCDTVLLVATMALPVPVLRSIELSSVRTPQTLERLLRRLRFIFSSYTIMAVEFREHCVVDVSVAVWCSMECCCCRCHHNPLFPP